MNGSIERYAGRDAARIYFLYFGGGRGSRHRNRVRFVVPSELLARNTNSGGGPDPTNPPPPLPRLRARPRALDGD